MEDVLSTNVKADKELHEGHAKSVSFDQTFETLDDKEVILIKCDIFFH